MRVKFYLTRSGRSPVEEFLKKCSADIRSEFLDAVLLLTAGETLGMPQARSLSSVHRGLHELRLKDRAGNVRVLYFVKKKDAVYMLHAFSKKTQKLPKKQLNVARQRLKEI